MKNWKKIAIAVVVILLLLAIYVLYQKSLNVEKRFLDNNWTEGNRLSFITAEPHGLKKGDKVLITQAPGAQYPQYDGEQTALEIVSDRQFITDRYWLGSTPPNPGVFKRISVF